MIIRKSLRDHLTKKQLLDYLIDVRKQTVSSIQTKSDEWGYEISDTDLNWYKEQLKAIDKELAQYHQENDS